MSKICFEKMCSLELMEYAKSFDFQSKDDFDAEELLWSYEPNFLLSNIKIRHHNTADDWIDWINNEQEMFKKEMPYDRYKEIEDYWIHNPNIEPVIVIQRADGTHDISDGWHRTGLAYRNKLKSIPVILGIKNI